MPNTDITKYLARRRAAADFVRTTQVPGHEVHAEKDWAKAFASRPGSDDWKAHCTCGWASSSWQHGETEALASAKPHVRDAYMALVNGAIGLTNMIESWRWV